MEINGAELNYELRGEGPAVVLLHEGVCDLRMWDELVESLAPEFTVLRYDMRGYGESTLPPGPFSQTRDLLGLLDHVAIDRAALVGVSYGGRVALDTAFSVPERITCLVLAAPALRGHEWSDVVREFGSRRVVALRADWTRQDPRITATLASLGRNAVPVYALYLPGEPAPRLLPEVLTPSVVLAGLADVKPGTDRLTGLTASNPSILRKESP